MEYPTHEEYVAVFGEYEEDADTATTEEQEGGGEPITTTTTEEAAPVENAEGTPMEEGGAEGTESGAEPAESATAEEGAGTKNQVQSAEERHRQAALRRAREKQEWQDKTQQAVDAAYAKLLGGQINPFTGKPITTQAEYEAYEAMKAQQSTNNALQKAGIDPLLIQQMVQQEVAPMKQQMRAEQAQRYEAQAAEYNRRMEEAKEAAAKSIAALYDPSIQSFDDILAMPTVGKFNDLLQKGNSFEESFYLANREAIDKRRAAAAYQKGVAAGASRQHLSPAPAASGAEPVIVPADVARSYREVTPGMTDAEIAKEYAAYLKCIK
ncbi:MAG: hypothetical protein J6J01_04535 [Oscillospiraceae bacterium]|nr:hypothetical protein [Oscillospiraceae bacterium]